MDTPTPAIVDPLHLFTSAQTAVITREIGKRAAATGCHIQLVVGKGVLNVERAASANLPSDVDARLVIDETTREIGYGLNSYECLRPKLIPDHNDRFLREALDLDYPTAKALNAKLNKHSALDTLSVNAVAASYEALNAIATQQEGAYHRQQAVGSASADDETSSERLPFSYFAIGMVFFAAFCAALTWLRFQHIRPKAAGAIRPTRLLNMNAGDFGDETTLSSAHSLLRECKTSRETVALALVSIREGMRDQDREDAWTTLYYDTMKRLRELVARYALYLQHMENADPSVCEAAHQAVVTDAKKFILELVALDKSLKPRMTESVAAAIIGSSAHGKDVPLALRERILAIERNAERMESSLPARMMQEAYLVREVRSRYIPDTMAAYYKARASEPETADRLLGEQLATIEGGVDAAAVAIAAGNADELRANGLFLRERFPHAGANAAEEVLCRTHSENSRPST